METTKRIYKVDRKEINYLRVTIESYDGMALVKTIDPQAALIELRISPGCEPFVYELLKNLKEHEIIKIDPENL